ncbi:MAG: CDP-glycerol glycerophosphotransferase family protein [Clostridia bacterium]|nr:CDP-glycerol glycerophosphotransferase family protein [Clostridia bacterium]
MKKAADILRRFITFYILWRAAFLLGCILPRKKQTAVFAFNRNYSSLPDNMAGIKRYLENEGWNCVEYASPKSSLKRFLSDIKFQLLYARVSAVFVTDTFDPIYAHKPRKGSRNVQLWHACGAFKKFGSSTLDGEWGGDKRLWKLFPRHNTYTDVFVSAEKVVPCYAEAFNCDESVVKALGVPRTDVFFDGDFVVSGRTKVEKALPEINGRKIILYAPTFRGNTPQDAHNDKVIDFEKFRQISDEYVIVLKYHPFTYHCDNFPQEDRARYGDFVFMCPEEIGIDAAMCAADIVVSDYSSLVFEYSLLKRPMIFFAYDLEDYERSRNYYFGFRNFVPGPIVRTDDELLQAVKSGADTQKTEQFRRDYMSACDGHSTEKIAEYILKKYR